MIIINITDKEAGYGACDTSVIALGNFDGVHIAHTALLSKTVAVAREKNISSAVFTFSEHSGKILRSRNVSSITSLNEKLELFRKIGIDKVYLADFEKVRDYTPSRFVDEILKKKINAEFAVCGYDFRFGVRGTGNSSDLTDLMDGNTYVMPPVMKGNEVVSSTLIRKAIEDGDVGYAKELLGRPFFIEFPVVHGKELGRSIGVPTINQNFPEGFVVPKNGVYACRVNTDMGEFSGVANVGVHPTVETSNRVNCETFIIGFDGSLYDKTIRVSFYKRLRDEKKFDSLDALKAQIEKDIEITKDYFKN